MDPISAIGLVSSIVGLTECTIRILDHMKTAVNTSMMAKNLSKTDLSEFIGFANDVLKRFSFNDTLSSFVIGEGSIEAHMNKSKDLIKELEGLDLADSNPTKVMKLIKHAAKSIIKFVSCLSNSNYIHLMTYSKINNLDTIVTKMSEVVLKKDLSDTVNNIKRAVETSTTQGSLFTVDKYGETINSEYTENFSSNKELPLYTLVHSGKKYMARLLLPCSVDYDRCWRAFTRELIILLHLNNQTVAPTVKLMTTVTVQNDNKCTDCVAFITEKAEGSTLRDMVVRQDNNIEWSDKISIAIDIVKCISVIHGCNITHRNMRDTKVLICKQSSAMITGLSRGILGESTTQQHYTDEEANMWKDPRQITRRKMTSDKISDLFSISNILWRLAFMCPHRQWEDISIKPTVNIIENSEPIPTDTIPEGYKDAIKLLRKMAIEGKTMSDSDANLMINEIYKNVMELLISIKRSAYTCANYYDYNKVEMEVNNAIEKYEKDKDNNKIAMRITYLKIRGNIASRIKDKNDFLNLCDKIASTISTPNKP